MHNKNYQNSNKNKGINNNKNKVQYYPTKYPHREIPTTKNHVTPGALKSILTDPAQPTKIQKQTIKRTNNNNNNKQSIRYIRKTPRKNNPERKEM